MSRNKYYKPVPEKFQKTARLRRLRQQHRDGKITAEALGAAIPNVLADYADRWKVPGWAKEGINFVPVETEGTDDE